MKKILFGLLIPVSAAVISCSKDDSPTPTPPASVTYLSVAAGNRWEYENTRNPSSTPVVTNYSLIATTGDTTINARSYHKFTRTDAFGAEYYYINGAEHFEYLSLPVLDTIRSENLFLRSDLTTGYSWTQNLAPVTYLSITANLSKQDTIIETGLTRTVQGITYDSVIHVRGKLKVVSINSPFPITPTLVSVIDNYYAPRVGRIYSYINVHLTESSLSIDEQFENKAELVSTNFQ